MTPPLWVHSWRLPLPYCSHLCLSFHPSPQGPISSCRSFDFTLAFENALLTIATSLLIFVALIEIVRLSFRPTLVQQRKALFRSGTLRHVDAVGLVRVVLALAHVVVAAASVGLVANDASLQQRLARNTILPALSLSLLSALLLAPYSFLARVKLANGSLIIPMYLFAAVLLDACRLRTCMDSADLRHTAQTSLLTSQLVLKVLLFFAENTSGIQTMQSTRESSAGFASKMLFWWLKDVIWTGFRRPLEMVNLETLADEFEGRKLGRKLAKTFYYHGVSRFFPYIQKKLRKLSLIHNRHSHRHHRHHQQHRTHNQGQQNGAYSIHESVASLEMSDLRDTSRRTRADHLDANEKDTARKSLLWACLLAFPQSFLAPVVPKVCMSSVTLALPYLIRNTLSFAESHQNPATAQPTAYGWGLVGAYGFVYLVLALSTGQFFWACDKSQVKLRGAILDMIYRKSLRIHLSVARTTGGGAAANLMSVDLERFVRAIIPFHSLWSGLLVVIAASYLLYRELGLVFFATLVSVLLSLALPPIASTGIGQKQSLWSKATDERVNLTSSAIANAKGVKFMAYEDRIVENLIQGRDKEIKHGWTYYKQLLVVSSLTNLVTEVMALFTFVTIAIVDVLTGSHRLNIQLVVTTLTLMQLLQNPLLEMGQNYGAIIAALVSLRRIEDFLAREEGPTQGFVGSSSSSMVSGSNGSDHVKQDMARDSIYAASFQSASVGWSSNQPVLVNVTLDIPRNKLTMVCGTLASGKSTLLQAMLGETNVLSGSLHLPLKREPIAYVAQDGWLQEAATIRDNIVFNGHFDAELYQTVILATALDIDLGELPLKDQSPAKSLSGGQRQRVTLARALYADCPAYILDDFTSALDAETASHVWKSLVGEVGLLRGKTVVMATNALEFLHHADLLVRLDGGKVVESGSYDSFSQSGMDAVRRASLQSERLTADAAGKDAKQKNGETEGGENDDDEDEEHVEQGTVRWSVYLTWLKSMGLTCVLVAFIGNVVHTAATLGWNVYLQFWARAEAGDVNHHHTLDWMGGLIGLIFFTIAIFCVELFVLCYGALVNTGTRLHKAELLGVFGAPLSFFEENSAGRIINRFSQDLFVLDWEIVLALANFLGNILNLLGQLLLLVIPAPYLGAIIVVVVVFYFAIQRLYAPASRQLRRLEMATKSPIYALFSETSTPAGLATIRALNRQDLFIEMNIGRLNRSQQPYLYLQAVRRWLQTWLNMLSLLINVALVTFVVALRNTTSIGILGVGLVQATNISGSLNQSLVAFTELEIASIALERILAFARLPKEQSEAVDGQLRIKIKPEDVRGEIEFRDVSISYKPEFKPALRDLNLTIRAGEKIGICGRSGSGKSTLLLAIFSMIQASQGEVYLDGQPLSKMSASALRNSLTIVPQNALILASSVRENLDPGREKDDVSIWNALDSCRLLSVVKAFPDGLDTVLTSSNVNLSAGQRQLFSLARAMLRQRKVLVLDEATSNMDHQSDAAVQQVLRTQFQHCTIITVAHRIATIRDYDRIVVLAAGQMVELDSPDNLIKRPDGIFSALAAEQNVK